MISRCSLLAHQDWMTNNNAISSYFKENWIENWTVGKFKFEYFDFGWKIVC